jgi:hypothetical protein
VAAALGLWTAALSASFAAAGDAAAADSLRDGLVQYFPFEGQVQSLNPAGVRCRAGFSRATSAHDPALRVIPADAPRFPPGRFCQGVLIEYGRCSSGPNAARNALSAEIAAAEAAPDGFLSLNGARLGRAPGLQGEAALRVEAVKSDSGFSTRAVTAPKAPGQIFSVFLKGPPGTGLEIRAALDGQDAFLARRDILLTGDWQQESLSLEFDTEHTLWHKEQENTPPLVFSVVAKQPTTFLADALMLEPRQGYAGRRGPTTWVEPGHSRDGEILQPGRLRADDRAGTIAFWAQLRGRMDWRTLLTLGDGTGWQAPLRLDARNDQRLEIQMPNAKRSARGESRCRRQFGEDNAQHLTRPAEADAFRLLSFVTTPPARSRERIHLLPLLLVHFPGGREEDAERQVQRVHVRHAEHGHERDPSRTGRALHAHGSVARAEPAGDVRSAAGTQDSVAHGSAQDVVPVAAHQIPARGAEDTHDPHVRRTVRGNLNHDALPVAPTGNQQQHGRARRSGPTTNARTLHRPLPSAPRTAPLHLAAAMPRTRTTGKTLADPAATALTPPAAAPSSASVRPQCRRPSHSARSRPESPCRSRNCIHVSPLAASTAAITAANGNRRCHCRTAGCERRSPCTSRRSRSTNTSDPSAWRWGV